MSHTPDLMPILDRGAHTEPAAGACIMEYASLLAGEEWGDHPACTHPTLARWARRINDIMPDEDRHLLLPLLPRLMGTGTHWPRDTHRALTDALASAIYRSTWPKEYERWCSNMDWVLSKPPPMESGPAVRFLANLIDVYDRVTGRGPVPDLSEADMRILVDATS